MRIDLSKMIDDLVEFNKNLWAFLTFRTITFQEYIVWECEEIFGDENKWYAGENLKHPPSNMDCQRNYIDYKADKAFHKKYHYLVERTWQKKIRCALTSIWDSFTTLWREENHKKWA
jgi:hypothetical protein